MRITAMVTSEILARPVNFLLSMLVVVAAATLFIVGPTLINGYAGDTKDQLASLQNDTDQLLNAMQQETDQMLAEMDDKTRLIMRDMGVNLRIVHRETNMGDFYSNFVAVDFPEDYVTKLANANQVVTVVHLVATLQERVKWNDRTVFLVGMLPVLTQSQKNAERQHMAQPVEEGTVVVGSELAAGLKESVLAESDKNGNGQLDAGDELDVLGRKFTVAEVRPEAGSVEDIQLILHLHDAQKLVDKPGRIHQILALNCKCKGNRISVIRQELEGVLPDTKVTEDSSRATAREEQRDLVASKRKAQLKLVEENQTQQMALVKTSREQWERALRGLIAFTLPLEVLVAAIVVGLMAWINVRERRSEIGLLRALGKRTGQIAALFLVKSMLLGLFGGLLAIGACALTYLLLPSLMDSLTDGISLEHYRPSLPLLAFTVLGAPLVTCMASYLPTLNAITQDPAIILNDH
jgi:hypothetical protein